VRNVPWWGVVSAAAAPVLLIGGWTVAAGLQPGSFNAVVSTISALAARGAADRWVMTLALAGTGACYVLTGLALRLATLPGRLILMAGGVATVLVAANPQPAGGGSSLAHTSWAAVGFIALAVWPLAASRQAPPAGLRPAGSACAGAVLAGLLLWFGVELITAGRQVGLAERVLAGAQAAWPLIFVLASRRRGRDPDPGQSIADAAPSTGLRLLVRPDQVLRARCLPGVGSEVVQVERSGQ
jgi:hypothetical protein